MFHPNDCMDMDCWQPRGTKKMTTTDKKATNIMKEITFNPELFAELSRRISNFIIFDKWNELPDIGRYKRDEPGRVSTRVFVYENKDGSWCYRIGVGVICGSGLVNETPFQDAESAMKAVDEILEQQDDIILVK